MVNIEDLKVGDRVMVKLTGELFDGGLAEVAGLVRGEIRKATVASIGDGFGRVNLDGVENPYSYANPKPLVWGSMGPGYDNNWQVEVVEVDPTNRFKVGDRVKTKTDMYGLRGHVGEIVRIDPWNLAYVRIASNPPLVHYAYELEKIELPEEEPMAEWELELLEPVVEVREFTEHGGVAVNDHVFIENDDLYGIEGRVTRIASSEETDGVYAHIDTESHGELHVRWDEVVVMPTMKQMQVSGVTDEIFLGIAREALVSSGIKLGFPREQVKTFTESALTELRDYLAEIRTEAWKQGANYIREHLYGLQSELDGILEDTEIEDES